MNNTASWFMQPQVLDRLRAKAVAEGNTAAVQKMDAAFAQLKAPKPFTGSLNSATAMAGGLDGSVANRMTPANAPNGVLGDVMTAYKTGKTIVPNQQEGGAGGGPMVAGVGSTRPPIGAMGTMGNFVGSLKGYAPPPPMMAKPQPMPTKRMLAPDGSARDVPAEHVEHYLRLGARLAE